LTVIVTVKVCAVVILDKDGTTVTVAVVFAAGADTLISSTGAAGAD